MHILAFISVGVLVGWCVGLVFRGRDYYRWADVTLGAIGAIIGAYALVGDFSPEMMFDALGAAFLGSVLFSIIGHFVLYKPLARWVRHNNT